jgi:hypothetical protein
VSSNVGLVMPTVGLLVFWLEQLLASVCLVGAVDGTDAYEPLGEQ